ncbi:M20 family metallo-hydrolase [Millionella massiliensis]|uniref:M20 family metallo-hydrolase n=1 Tax=Millionella massiliensis TaxID=1871023 RepID=UPI0024B75703|nr:M20 family metallo-hydrolase [Millionella massiliensis]
MNPYIELLRRMIATPSVSREEERTADLLAEFLTSRGVDPVHRSHNNVWVRNRWFDPAKPTILLNSHHDTVKPNSAYTRDPFAPDIEVGKLYGLGSNDAGASVVSLIAAFLHFYEAEGLRYNLCLALTAEEEVSGRNGIESILPELGELSFAIVGEPTGMELAIAERGLMVLDCVAHGKAGHAARNEGDNAIYRAMQDIEWFRTYRFPQESQLFGNVKMSVTVINAGTQHNVVPAECRYTVDVRVTDRYTNEEVLEIVRSHVASDVTPRSTRLKPSYIDPSHPIVAAGLALGRHTYGSPTTSDQALLSIPSLKMGPGDSARSHSADEFVYVSEIEAGIDQYIAMLEAVCR